MAVRDSHGVWWSNDCRYRWSGSDWRTNQISVTKVPLSEDAISTIRIVSLVRSSIFFFAVILPALGLLFAAVWGAFVVVALFAAMILGLVIGGCYTWAYARQDIAGGTAVRVTGGLILIDEKFRTYGSSWGGAVRACYVNVGPHQLRLAPDKMDAVLREAALVRHGHDLMYEFRDVWVLTGSVEYAAHLKLPLRIVTSDGRLNLTIDSMPWSFLRG